MRLASWSPLALIATFAVAIPSADAKISDIADFQFITRLVDHDTEGAKSLIFGDSILQEKTGKPLTRDGFVNEIRPCRISQVAFGSRDDLLVWDCGGALMARAAISVVGDKVQVGKFLKFVVVQPPVVSPKGQR